MTVGLVVVALVALVAAGVLAWLAAERAHREAQAATERLLEASLKLHEMRPEPPKPEIVVVPPPDLQPYLAQLTRMATGMARELAAGISLVVAGPPQPKPAEAQGQDDQGGGPGPGDDEDHDGYVPAWDTDETWGIGEPRPDSPEEWTAEWAGAHAEAPFGSGGTHLPEPGL